MMSSWRLGRISHIPVRFHWTMVAFPFLVVLFGVLLESNAEVMLQLSLVFALYATLIFHEAGHVLIGTWVHLPFREITLYPLGGIARLSLLSDRPRQEIWMALAGPVVHGSFALAIALGCLIADISLMPHAGTEPFGEAFWMRLFWLNVLFTGLQLLPCFPFDGGRIFRGALALSARRYRATEVAAMLSSVVAIVFIVLGIVGIIGYGRLWGLLLIGLGVVVHVSGQQELMLTAYFASLQHPPIIPPGGSAPMQAPLEQLIDSESKPTDTDFTGFTWNAKNHLWIEWRDGIAVAANALIGD